MAQAWRTFLELHRLWVVVLAMLLGVVAVGLLTPREDAPPVAAP
jgi:hypothetical protein